MASPRDAACHIESRIQKCCGDPSPAHTVAALFDLTPENARQIDCRVRRRLKGLVATDKRFADLDEVEWIGEGREATPEQEMSMA